MEGAPQWFWNGWNEQNPEGRKAWIDDNGKGLRFYDEEKQIDQRVGEIPD
jgi:hypothetical protein